MFLKQLTNRISEQYRRFLGLPEASERRNHNKEQIDLLETIQIDTQKGICLINGTDVSKQGKYLKLEFENGEWSLMITTDKYFSSVHSCVTTGETSQ